MFLNGILEHTALCTKTERLGSVGETGRDPGMWESGSGSYPEAILKQRGWDPGMRESGSGSYPETERLGFVGETGRGSEILAPDASGSRSRLSHVCAGLLGRT